MADIAVSESDREKRLEQWIADYADAVLRTCFVFLTDASLAEDAMQDTFLKAWRSMDTFEGRNGCNEKTWLLRIAVNVCRSYARGKWFRHVDLRQALDDLPSSHQAIPPEDRTLFLDILRLPVKYKHVILLYFYQDMTLEECARLLSISRSAVHHRLKRAQALLRPSLMGRDHDEA